LFYPIKKKSANKMILQLFADFVKSLHLLQKERMVQRWKNEKCYFLPAPFSGQFAFKLIVAQERPQGETLF